MKNEDIHGLALWNIVTHGVVPIDTLLVHGFLTVTCPRRCRCPGAKELLCCYDDLTVNLAKVNGRRLEENSRGLQSRKERMGSEVMV